MYFSNTFLSVNSNTNIMWNRKDIWSWKGSTPAGHLANVYRESPWFDDYNYQGYLIMHFPVLKVKSSTFDYLIKDGVTVFSHRLLLPPTSYLRSALDNSTCCGEASQVRIFSFSSKIFPYLCGAGLHWWRWLRVTDGCFKAVVLWGMWAERRLGRRSERSSQFTRFPLLQGQFCKQGQPPCCPSRFSPSSWSLGQWRRGFGWWPQPQPGWRWGRRSLRSSASAG